MVRSFRLGSPHSSRPTQFGLTRQEIHQFTTAISRCEILQGKPPTYYIPRPPTILLTYEVRMGQGKSLFMAGPWHRWCAVASRVTYRGRTRIPWGLVPNHGSAMTVPWLPAKPPLGYLMQKEVEFIAIIFPILIFGFYFYKNKFKLNFLSTLRLKIIDITLCMVIVSFLTFLTWPHIQQGNFGLFI